MPDLFEVSLDDMIVEVRREVEMRRHLYPTWKANAGRNKRNMLDRQFDVMAAVLKHLEWEREHYADRMDQSDGTQ